MKRWDRIFCLFGFVLLLGCQNTEGESEQTSTLTTIPAPPPKPSSNPAVLFKGEQIYATHFASCHGANLEGEANWKERNKDGAYRAPPHDDTGHTWHHPDSVLIESVQLGGARLANVGIDGISNMPAYKDILSDEEITAVLTYIKSTWPEEIQDRQW